ncbi:MAG: N-formylglutamate amidohydrolase, partial [Pseudomonadota bacterium]
EIIEELEVAFVSAGLVVSRNAPFAGAYVAQTYGRPSHGSHVVQIEIDRALYMNERLIQRSEGFDDLRQTISNVLAHVIGPARRSVPLAAE